MGCIYKHTLILDVPSKGKAYIGKSIKKAEYRWDHGKGYLGKGTVFEAAILKYGGLAAWDTAWKHEKIETNISDEQLSNREKYWIEYYHTYIRDPQCWGYNMTPGGEGGPITGQAVLMIDMKTLKVIKEFISASEAARYFNGYVGGISRACLDSGLSYKGYYWCYKDSWYEDWQPRKQIIPGARPIYQIDEKTLNITNTFDTIMDAARWADVSKNTITNCADLQHTSINGYYYLYIEDYTEDWKPKPIKATRHGMRAVINFETNVEYDSLATAGKVYNTTASNILTCCNNYNYAIKKKYHFCYKEDYNKLKEHLEAKQQEKDGMHIICFETKQEYSSITEVEKLTGINKSQVSQCCHGTALTAGPDHYHWCYKKDYKEDIQWQKAKLYEGKCKKVRCITTGVIYKSASEAFRQTDIRHIPECCNHYKGYYTAGGLEWEYIE